MLGLGAARLEADMNRLMALLFHQGVLDEQFMQLQQLQDESSPNFVSEVISIYFRESEKLLKNLRSLLADRECTDYTKIGIHLNQLMGSSSSIGAKRVRTVCLAFRAASEHSNWSGSRSDHCAIQRWIRAKEGELFFRAKDTTRSGCLRSLEVLEHEYCYLKTKLHELFQMEQHRVMAAGARYHPALS